MVIRQLGEGSGGGIEKGIRDNIERVPGLEEGNGAVDFSHAEDSNNAVSEMSVHINPSNYNKHTHGHCFVEFNLGMSGAHVSIVISFCFNL